jgi:hypothetical protein
MDVTVLGVELSISAVEYDTKPPTISIFPSFRRTAV